MRKGIAIDRRSGCNGPRRLRLVCIAACLLQLTGCSLLGPRATVKYIQYPVQRGDTLRTIGQRFNVSATELVEVNDVDPRHLRIGQILKVPYRGQDLARTASDYRAGTKAFLASGNQRVSAGLRKVNLGEAGQQIGKLGWPVEGGKLSSRFGWRWLSFHEGIDISAPEGTPVRAALPGTVVYSGNGLSGYGNLVVIKSSGILTVYAHNYRNRVSVGENVDRGEEIAEVGETGHATGPHLHFETRIKDNKGRNVAVDPIAFLARA